MAGTPTKRRKTGHSRRKLGRGQTIPVPGVTVTITATGSVAHVVFSVPVVINGNVPMTVAGKTFVSQTIVSQTQVDVTYSGALTGLAWAYPGVDQVIKSMQGGFVAQAAGTFA